MSPVAVTGAGLVTSVGMDRDQSFAGFLAGASGLRPFMHLDPSPFRIRWAYEISDGVAEATRRASAFLERAVAEAVQQADLDLNGRRVVAVVGTGLRELRSLELWYSGRGNLRLSELHFAETVRRTLGRFVPVFTLSNACSASNFALGVAVDVLALGDADIVLAAGCDTITASMFGFIDFGAPQGIRRVEPFQRGRQGVLLGEGAAAVVVERAEEGRRTPIAIIRGVGMSCDAVHPTALDRAGILLAMRDAHVRAGTAPEDMDLIVVHGTGTPLNDQVETMALQDLLGEHLHSVPVTALKSMIGHTSGASGLVGVVAAIEAMLAEKIPPTIHLTDPDDAAADLDIVQGEPRHRDIRFAQVNAFGFGGVNAVVILERVEACDGASERDYRRGNRDSWFAARGSAVDRSGGI